MLGHVTWAVRDPFASSSRQMSISENNDWILVGWTKALPHVGRSYFAGEGTGKVLVRSQRPTLTDFRAAEVV